MSSTSATQSNQYDLVSSFYGPGAVMGWYLTALACLISFSLHPRKRLRDSITADLIAVLTFPTVAAADLITQVRSYPREGATLGQKAASIEATLIVTETFLAIDVVLFLLAVGFSCVKRGCLLATVALFCFSTACYVKFSPSVSPSVGQTPNRPFLDNFGGMLFIVMAVLLICVICALILIALFFAMLRYQHHVRPSERDVEATRREREREVEATRRDWERDFKQSQSIEVLTIITKLLLPMFIASHLLLVYFRILIDSPSPFWPWTPTAASRIAHRLIPRSNTSVKELEQAVALLAGATVLGFSLYSTAETYYQAWLSKSRAITQQRETELRTLSHNQAPSH